MGWSVGFVAELVRDEGIGGREHRGTEWGSRTSYYPTTSIYCPVRVPDYPPCTDYIEFARDPYPHQAPHKYDEQKTLAELDAEYATWVLRKCLYALTQSESVGTQSNVKTHIRRVQVWDR